MTQSVFWLQIDDAAVRIARLKPVRKDPGDAAPFAVKRRSADSIPDTARRIRETIAAQGLAFGPVSVALGSGRALIQKVAFPFSDTRKINRVLPFELENHLPVAAADYVWDFLPASRDGRQETVVFVILYPRQEVQDWVSQLARQGLPVQGVELDLTLLNAQAEHAVRQGWDNQLFLDLQWTRTGLVWRRENALLAIRSLPCGVKDLFAEMLPDQEALDVTILQKTLDALPREQRQRVVQGNGACSLGQQIKVTCMQAGDSLLPAGLVLAGPGGGLDPLSSVLEELTGLPSSPWHPAGGQRPAQNSEPADDFFQASAALNLKQRGRRRFAFLPRATANGDPPRVQGKHLVFPALALCCILASLAVSAGLDISLAQRRLDELQDRLEQTFSSMVPDADPGLRPLQYAGVVRSRIQKLQSGPGIDFTPRIKVTRALASISRALPKDLGLQVHLLIRDGLSFRVSGVAPDFKTVDQAKNRLAAESLFTGVEIVGANADPEGRKVDFSLRLSLAESGSWPEQ